MSELEVKEYWDRQPCNSGWGKPFEEGTLEWFKAIEEKRKEAYPHISKFACYDQWRGRRVLEIGSGLGCDTIQFAMAGAIVTAIDISPHSAQLTRKHLEVYGLKGVTLCLNAENLPYKDCQFDLVYSWGVIHHSPNPPKVISEVYRVMKDGATFKAMLYNRYSICGLIAYMIAVKQHHPFISLKTAFANNAESPGTQAYTSGEIGELLKQFTEVKITPDLMAEWEIIGNSPRLRLLSRVMGIYPKGLASWYLVEAKKA